MRQNRPRTRVSRRQRASGNTIPTFGSTTRELNLGSQLFSHNFIRAKVKQPILGRDFLAENRLVENYAGRFLTQIRTDLFIPAVHYMTRRAGHVNQVQIDQQRSNILKNFPQVTKVSSSGYSKLQPQHGVEHVIQTGDSRPARSPAPLLFGKKRAAAEHEFRAMEGAGIVIRSSGSP